MEGDNASIDELARTFARTGAAAFRDSGRLYRTISGDAWNGPTGCAKWTMHELAGHTVGEGVWFPTVVRGVTEGMRPLEDYVWSTLKQLPGTVIADTLIGAADDLEQSVEATTTDQLQRPVDLGWTRMPLWRGLYVGLLEGVYHNWDAHVGVDPRATIPLPWAQQVAVLAADIAPTFARRNRARDNAGTYLLEVGDNVGPVTITAADGTIEAERGTAARADVTVHLTADQYVRLVAGRLPLRTAIDNGDVRVDGDEARAEGLNQLFAGIAN